MSRLTGVRVGDNMHEIGCILRQISKIAHTFGYYINNAVIIELGIICNLEYCRILTGFMPYSWVPSKGHEMEADRRVHCS